MRELPSNIARTLGRQLLAALLQIGTVVVVARALGPAGNGQYAVALLLLGLLIALLSVGISPGNVNSVTRGCIGVQAAARSNFRLWCWLVPLGSMAAGVAVLGEADMLFRGVPESVLWFALLALPVSLLQSYLACNLQGLPDFRRFNLGTLIQPAATFDLVAVAVTFGGRGSGASVAQLTQVYARILGQREIPETVR